MEQFDVLHALSTQWLAENGVMNGGELSSSRTFLEPILEEETTEDEDEDEEEEEEEEEEVNCHPSAVDRRHRDLWVSYEHVWSSDSETDSVIEVLVKQEPDAVSERDFVCPAKRRRRDFFIENSPKMQKSKFGTDLCEPRSHLDDDIFYDDSLSYQSLSRSSSLIQFESLERQMQCESFGNSTPSLVHLTDETDCGDNELKSKLKINFFDNNYDSSNLSLQSGDHLRLGFGSIRIGGALGNNSFSNGIAAHSGFERKCLLQQLRQEASDPVAKFKRECIRSRNSAENLSDDSGYCESAGLKRKSKSIPTLNANSMDYMGDYDEYDDKFENSKSLNSIVTHVSSSGGGGGGGRKLYSNRSTRSPSTSATPPSPMPTACTVRTASHSSGPTRRSHSTSNNKTYDSLNINTFASCSHHMPSTDDAKNNWRNCDGKTTAATQNISQSLPDLCDHTASKLSSIASFFDDYNHKTADDSCYGRSSSHPIAEFYVRNRDVSIVSSVPNELNLSAVEDMYNELEWCERELNVIRLNQQLQIQQQQQQQQQHRIINSSHYNLTALDYSAGGSGGGVGFGNSNSNSHHTSSSYNNIHNKSTTIAAAMSNKSLNQQKRKSDEINTCNFLLDEMSMNFNRDISIINDRSPEYEPPMEDCVKPRRSSPPQPPPRKLLPTPKQHNPDHVADHEESAGGDRGGDDLHNNKCVGSHDMQSTFGEGSGATNESHELNNPHETKHSSTFDLDPTNLVTCYALSMERCNFDIDESNEPSIKQQYYTKPTTVHQQRSLVVSTPNLSTFKTVSEYKSRGSNNRHTADDHRSRNQYLPESTSCSVSNLVTSTIPCNELQSILHNRPIPDGKNNSVAAVGAELSRTSLKEVSFCPVVSQFTWNQASTETDDSGEIDCGVVIENGVECHSDNTTERAPINIQLGDVSSDDSTYGNQMSGKEVTLTTMGRQTITMTNNTVNDDRELTPATECDRDTPADAFSVNKKHTNKATSNTNNKMNVSAVSSNRMQQCVGVTNDHASSSTTNSRSDNAIRNGEGNAIVSGERERVQQQQSVKNKFSASEYPSKSLSMLLENVNPSSADAGSANSVEIKSASGIINNNKRKDELFMEPKKKHKRGFLSRLSGFRFSLRGKKKHQSNATSVDNNKVYNNNGGQQDASDDRNQITSKCPDFVYIPLKEPTTNVQSQFYVTRQSNDEFIANERRAVSVDREDYPIVQRQQQQQQKVTTKPPLPRQAPRVVGVCAKPPHVQGRGEHSPIANSTPHRNDGAGHAPRTTQFNAWKIDDQRSILRGADPTNSNRTWSGASADQHEEDDLLDELERDQCDYRQQQRSGIGYAGRVGDTSNYHNKHSGKIGLIETNLDTHETIITGKTRSLIELGPQMGGQRLHQNHRHHHHHHNQHHQAGGKNKNDDDDDINIVEPRRPHKSMEFLLDKENQRNVIPPENELQKIHDGNNPALSEHQLRVQASLQRLNIPDWFKQYTGNTSGAAGVPIAGGPRKPDTIYSGRRRNLESGGWAALNSKTTSLSSLGSNRSERSPVLLSPSAHSHHGQTGYSRWSTSQINSSQTSPSVSTRGSFSRGGLNSSVLSGSSITYGGAGGASSVIRNSMRQPYYGWRSQEKLSQPRTPAERLASSLMTQQQHHQQKLQEKHQQQLQAAKQQHQGSDEVDVTPEIQSSIKEVTSAIVHYVNDQNNRTVSRSRSTSPSARKCWLESSFVGNRPLDSPQTPIINNSNSFSGGQGGSLTGGENTVPLDNTRINSVASPIRGLTNPPERPSPSSATLEDVLASLLGLPSDPYRSTGDTAKSSTSNTRLQIADPAPFRRHSEGDAQKRQQQLHTNNNYHPHPNQPAGNSTVVPTPASAPPGVTPAPHHQRRISLDISAHPKTIDLFKCQYPKCDAATSHTDAKKFYKSCHNCAFMYCSRECRKLHWERHRKACLHSRVSVLCRQVLSSCKDDTDTLYHLSVLARKGYIAHGRGVVRILFRSPESAEMFIRQGFQCLGEVTYVRWPDLMPAEMGSELYSELLRLSTEYKPESKMLLYVAICVISEVPGNASAPVKWERQLVSRCAKLKLSKTVLNEMSNTQPVKRIEPANDIIVLSFNTTRRTTVKSREIILVNIHRILRDKGVTLQKHYPEVFQRLSHFVDGTTEKFLPVTIHPRDSHTGKPFVCIIMSSNDEANHMKLPASDWENNVLIHDVCADYEPEGN